jgi:hypothetical protein
MKEMDKVKIYEDIVVGPVNPFQNGFHDHEVEFPVRLPSVPHSTDLDQFEPIDKNQVKRKLSIAAQTCRM